MSTEPFNLPTLLTPELSDRRSRIFQIHEPRRPAVRWSDMLGRLTVNMQNNYVISVKDTDEGRVRVVVVDWGTRMPGDNQGTEGVMHSAVEAPTESAALDGLRVVLGQRQAGRRQERPND